MGMNQLKKLQQVSRAWSKSHSDTNSLNKEKRILEINRNICATCISSLASEEQTTFEMQLNNRII